MLINVMLIKRKTCTAKESKRKRESAACKREKIVVSFVSKG